MKKHLSIFLVLLCPIFLFSQNAGIGTQNPESQLHLYNTSFYGVGSRLIFGDDLLNGKTNSYIAEWGWQNNTDSDKLELAGFNGEKFAVGSNSETTPIEITSGGNILFTGKINRIYDTLKVAGNVVTKGELTQLGNYVSNGADIKLELGEERVNDRSVTIDMDGGLTRFPDFGLSIDRSANGNSEINHRGSRNLIINGSGTGDIAFSTSSVIRATITDNGIMAGGDAVHDLGSFANRWKDVWATNGTIQISDKKTKNTVQNSEYGLDAVLALRPVTFYWNNLREQGRKVGLIAQEVKEVVSEVVYDKCINIDEEGNKTVIPAESLGMNYAELVPVLIKAIQEQQTQINELRDKLELLENHD